MISLTSNARFRQRVILYSNKYGVTKASNRFRISRNAIYEWKAKYNGHWNSLIDKSHRPHHHPLKHTQEEYDLITRYWNKNKDDKIVLWQKILDKEYRRSYKSICRAIKRLNLSREEKQRKAYKPKPYEHPIFFGKCHSSLTTLQIKAAAKADEVGEREGEKEEIERQFRRMSDGSCTIVRQESR